MQNEKVAICKNVEGYLDRLTKGKEYIVIKENEKNNTVRTICDNGRAQWFSRLCFELDGNPVLTLLDWEYDDKVDDNDNKDDWNWVEISFTLSDGSRRWSILYTPQGLINNLSRPNIDPPGLHIPHMIIVRSYKKDDIDKVLRYLDDCDELIEASLPLDGGYTNDNV